MPVFSILALIAYLLSLGLIVPSLVQKNSAYRRLALVSAVVALVCHAIALKHQIFDVGGGQNLTLLNIGSIVGLMICTIMTIVASQGRGWFLLPIVYSFAMINLALASLLPGSLLLIWKPVLPYSSTLGWPSLLMQRSSSRHCMPYNWLGSIIS